MPKTDDSILTGLNDPQRKAVLHTQGPTLILAGAGSGKTKALTHRIAYLIEQGVAPWQILAVTFTNKAATEMKERIKSLLHMKDVEEGITIERGTGRLPAMGTFHSICARILRRDIENIGGSRTFVIYDSDDQEKLIKSVLKKLMIDEKEMKPRAAMSYISRFKSEALSPAEAERQATTVHMHTAIQIYRRYQEALKEASALDFDDLILETVKLFREVPDVLDRYQETWRYINVDEYQDTNHAQYLLISLLAQKYRNICVIGDPDQSIYSFRGADIRNILEFKKEYPNALEVKLEQNYRSTQVILDASNAVISHNPNRPEKQMWTENKEGPKVIVQEVRDERAEAEDIVREAQRLKTSGVNLRDQVVLYRTNAQSRLIEEACLRGGVPYRILGGMKFYARKEVKDVLAYLYVILNPQDTLSLLRIINVPPRKLGDTTLGHIQAYASREQKSLWTCLTEVDQIDAVNEPAQVRIKQFTETIEHFRREAQREVVSGLTERLLSAMGMEEWLRDDTEEGEERWGNVLELVGVMRKYDQLDPHTSLTSFLEEVALVSEVDKLTTAKDDALTLMTLHLCKGLEFESVFVAGCEEGIFPHSNALFDKEQLEEERRLMYVGMTRAKKHLKLLFTRTRNLYGEVQSNAPSRFLDDLPDSQIERRSDELLSAFAWATESGRRKAFSGGKVEPFRQNIDAEFNQDLGYDDASQEPQFAVGMRVAHPSFGEGTIIALRGDVATITFDSGQKKTFALSIAPLRRID